MKARLPAAHLQLHKTPCATPPERSRRRQRLAGAPRLRCKEQGARRLGPLRRRARLRAEGASLGYARPNGGDAGRGRRGARCARRQRAWPSRYLPPAARRPPRSARWRAPPGAAASRTRCHAADRGRRAAQAPAPCGSRVRCVCSLRRRRRRVRPAVDCAVPRCTLGLESQITAALLRQGPRCGWARCRPSLTSCPRAAAATDAVEEQEGFSSLDEVLKGQGAPFFPFFAALGRATARGSWHAQLAARSPAHSAPLPLETAPHASAPCPRWLALSGALCA